MRRLFLQRQAIVSARPGFDKERLFELIERLGYVQVDSINVVERAHHLILFSREPGYRPGLLAELLEHATQRQFVYRHVWRPGDLVMWDNRAVLHRGRRYDLSQRRELRRSTVEDIRL